MATASEVRKSLMGLRENSIALKMDELTIAYGWSVIRLGMDIFDEKALAHLKKTPTEIVNEAMIACGKRQIRTRFDD